MTEFQQRWHAFSDARKAYHESLHKLVSCNQEILINELKKRLRSPERAQVLDVMDALDVRRLEAMLPDLLLFAATFSGLTARARSVLLERFPASELEQRLPLIESSFQKSYEEYRGLFEIYKTISPRLARQLAKKALASNDEDIREAGLDMMAAFED